MSSSASESPKEPLADSLKLVLPQNWKKNNDVINLSRPFKYSNIRIGKDDLPSGIEKLYEVTKKLQLQRKQLLILTLWNFYPHLRMMWVVGHKEEEKYFRNILEEKYFIFTWGWCGWWEAKKRRNGEDADVEVRMKFTFHKTYSDFVSFLFNCPISASFVIN